MAIGGYNQLSLTDLNTTLHERAYHFQSARSALYAYLSVTNIRTLYLPNYICDSIIPAIKALNIQIEFYAIDAKLQPEINFNRLDKTNSKILIINYFGLLNEQIKMLTAVEPELFIVDNSQALFCEHIEGTTSIYSPRKFLGIPDGGFLRTATKINMPETRYDASESVGHLLLRAAGDVQAGYARFLAAEQALECFIPKKISSISAHLIKCTNTSEIKEVRRRNYELLYGEFKAVNQIYLLMGEQTPLCYPLKLGFNVTGICKEFINSAIYLPRYWRSDFNGEVGEMMYENTLFLPVDERISKNEIMKLVKLIKDKL